MRWYTYFKTSATITNSNNDNKKEKYTRYERNMQNMKGWKEREKRRKSFMTLKREMIIESLMSETIKRRNILRKKTLAISC